MRLGRTRSFITLKGLHSDKTTSVSLNQYNKKKKKPSSRATGKTRPLLFADLHLDLGCSYILSSIHIWLSGYY